MQQQRCPEIDFREIFCVVLVLTQPVWKRFSYPNEYKQPGVKDLDATI